MKKVNTEKKISHLLRTVGQPTRLKILMAIGGGEVCVCHLEAMLGMRQAYISQHLMALRKAEVLLNRREGRFIFYRLRDPETLDLIQMAARIVGVAEHNQPLPVREEAMAISCVCPTCATA
jgi:ArsR family transcriptional regulator